MLVFAGFTPNSPLLLPSVNQVQFSAVKKTVSALQELSDEMYAAKPDSIIIMSSSQMFYDEAISINVADPYEADLSDVGDLGYHKKYHPDFSLIDNMQRILRKTEAPVSLSTDNKLNFGNSVPLHYLTQHLPDIKIVPIAACNLDQKVHFSIGQLIKQVILESKKRIAVIAAGDMSHALTKESPGGLHKDGKIFEKRLMSILTEKNVSGLLQINEELAKNAQDTSIKQLAMLFGVLDNINFEPKILSHEMPFGVGYAVAEFIM